jgi:Cu(I)/Ag(I) efflux system membrane fusion protein
MIPKHRKLILIAALAVLAAAAGGYLHHKRGRAAHEAHRTALWHCPMHPSYTSDKPGECPICGMTLVPSEAAAAPSSAPAGAVLYYRNPMDPSVTSPVPMKDSMGMDYVPVFAGENSASAVPGQGSALVDEAKRRLIGMKTEPVLRRRLKFTVRASGSVAYDPELYNAISEHHSAMVAREKVKDSPWPDVHERADALVRASALRLRQLGLAESQIDAYTGTEAVPENLLIGGAGGSVWVYAQIYEYEISEVRPGLVAEITTPAYPGRVFHGTVKAIDPNLTPETRSLRVRIEVPNPGGLLKLEMFVNAAIKADLGTRLALPEAALLDSGERKLAFVDIGEGRIEPREVRVGRSADGYYEILSGVREGEKVVTTANFLIDSESRLKAAVPEKR